MATATAAGSWIVATCMLAGVGCTSVKSSSLATSGMAAHMTVSAGATGTTTATASLNVDTSATDYVDLATGDTLKASTGAQTQAMARNEFLVAISYVASFDGAAAAGTPYAIAFLRSAQTSAPSSTCTLPAPFQASLAAPASSFSRAGDDVAIATTDPNEPDGMSLVVTGDCVKTTTLSFPDTGAVSVPRGTLVPAGSTQGSPSCLATVTVIRSRPGHLDPAFGSGGGIACNQTRSVTFTSAP